MTEHATTVVRIRALAHGGDGVGVPDSAQGPVWFIPGALAGELVEARPGHVAKRFVRGELVSVIEPAPNRVEPPCPLATRCGGCQWQHVRAADQAELKRSIVANSLRALVDDGQVAVAFRGQPDHYRRRARLHYRRDGDAWVLGFHEPRSHRITDVASCPVLVPSLDQAVARLRAVADQLPPQGEVLGLSDGTRTLLGLPGVRPEPAVIRALESLLDDNLVGIGLRGGRATHNLGSRHIEIDGGAGLPPMRANPFIFAQAQTGRHALVQHVARAARPDGRRILELFAGAGNLTRGLAKTAARVWASDTDHEAIDMLRGLAKAYHLPVNAKRQNAARLLPKLVQAKQTYDVAVLDPPRAGLGKEATEALCRIATERLVYVSCDVATLGRDLAVATARGFVIEDVSVFDLMPMTSQIEVVATLRRRGGR